MRGVDHDPLRFAALARQFGENLVEHAQATPANEPIVDRLVRAIVGRSVAPTQPVLDHEHDRADDPPIVHPRDPMRERKIPLNPTHLNPRQQKQISHGEASQPPPMNQPIRTPARTLIGPEPSSSTIRLESKRRIQVRVLLVDDDAAIARSIELMLKVEEINVYRTDLGEEGVDLGKIYDYDIILLDLNLPDISGYEVLRSLRSAKVVTPVLILSGLASIEDKIRGLGLGADDYLAKPFHKDELIARIHALVRRSKGHAQSLIAVGDLIVAYEAEK